MIALKMPNDNNVKNSGKNTSKKIGKNKTKKNLPSNPVNIPTEMISAASSSVNLSGSPFSPTELSSCTVKCMWEQHDTTDTDVHSEVYSKLAEDATYKLWELVNNIKVSARHSGGCVSQDLVNDVMKDSDVAPIIGAYNSPWEKIEYDGAYFYNLDQTLDLREEYLKQTTIKRSIPVCFNAEWMSDSEIVNDLNDFLECMQDGAFLEEDDDFELTMCTISTNYYTPSVVRSFLDRCVEVLAFDYTQDLLERTLKFLNAIIRNPFVRDTNVSEELLPLSKLFVCLILGSNTIPECSIKEEIEEKNIVPIANNFDNINQIDKIENLSSVFEITPSTDMETENLDIPPEFMEIKREDCEALLRDNPIKEEIFSLEDGQILLNDQDINIKSEFIDHFNDFDNYNSGDNYNSDNNNYANNEDMKTNEMFDNPSLNISETTSIEDNGIATAPQIYTKMCESYTVNDVSQTMGLLCNKWGFFEGKSTYLMIERLEQFFNDIDGELNDQDYQYICRAAIALWCMGELPFRELADFFYQINPANCPEYYQYYFNRAAIYLRGRRDFYFYEWLRDVCGDTISPFMLHYSRKIDRINRKYIALAEKVNSTENIFKIMPKVMLRTLPKPEKLNKNSELPYTEHFEDHVHMITKATSSKFTFRRPVILKARKPKPVVPAIQEYSQNMELLSRFNSKIVIAKRKIMKPLTNQFIKKSFTNLAPLQL